MGLSWLWLCLQTVENIHLQPKYSEGEGRLYLNLQRVEKGEGSGQIKRPVRQFERY